jgi:MerR family transcriptional regulator/heat shock protein HspR
MPRFQINLSLERSEFPQDLPIYPIGTAARLAGLHPQTLRQYDRLGLVVPGRAAGRGRRYSARDITNLREVQRLSAQEGINLAGIARILALQAANRELRQQLEALRRRVYPGQTFFAVDESGQAEAYSAGRRPIRQSQTATPDSKSPPDAAVAYRATEPTQLVARGSANVATHSQALIVWRS